MHSSTAARILLARASRVEASIYLALVAAVVVKYAGGSSRGVEILGLLHGLVYLGYVGLMFARAPQLGWTPRHTLWAVLLAAIPGGGFYVDRQLLRRFPSPPS